MHYVGHDRREQALRPHPRSPEGLRARFDRRSPARVRSSALWAIHGFDLYLTDKQALAHTDDPVADMHRDWDAHVDFGLRRPAFYLLMYGTNCPERRAPAAEKATALLMRFLDRTAAAGRLRVPPTLAARLCLAAVTDVTLSLIATPAQDRDQEISSKMRDALIDSLITDPAPIQDGGLASRALALDAALTTAAAEALPLRPAETTLLRDWLDQLARRSPTTARPAARASRQKSSSTRWEETASRMPRSRSVSSADSTTARPGRDHTVDGGRTRGAGVAAAALVHVTVSHLILPTGPPVGGWMRTHRGLRWSQRGKRSPGGGRTREVLNNELSAYVAARNRLPDAVEQELISRTDSAFPTCAGMRISTAQAALLTLLVKLVRPAFAVDVGTFTGYSALAVARGLLDGGTVLCCEASAPAIDIARSVWESAGVADRIQVRMGMALETLRALPEQPCVDFAFIDADKREYIAYWEELVARTRPGGLLLADNVLGFGTVADRRVADQDVLAIREFNQHVMADQRVDSVVLPLWDGLVLARRI